MLEHNVRLDNPVYVDINKFQPLTKKRIEYSRRAS
jgi:hypothetical protein